MAKSFTKIAVVLTTATLLFAMGCGENTQTVAPITKPVETQVSIETPAEPEPIEEVVDVKEELKATIKDEKHLVWFGSVRNDNTGNWRLSEYADSAPVESFAADYYNAFFEADNEIHAVINMATKTTAKISKVGNDALDVTLYTYVDKEEHDANILFSGDVISEYWVTISTGDIEALQ